MLLFYTEILAGLELTHVVVGFWEAEISPAAIAKSRADLYYFLRF